MHFKCKFIIISHLVLLVLDIKILMYESSCLVINKRNKLHCRFFFEVYLMINDLSGTDFRMSQQVLCCYKCYTFQVHQVKKDPKWVCKLCNEKQSLKQIFGR